MSILDINTESNMNIKRLKYFITVAEQKHFSRAAELIHISQPPLSQQIRLLEKELGMNLFVRTTRHVELTEAGLSLFENAKKAVSDLEQAVAYAQLVDHGHAGKFRLGFVSTAAVRLLADVLRRFREQYPDTSVECLHSTSREQAQALLDRSIDVGFLRGTPVDKNIDWRVIQRERLYAALPADHPFCRFQSIKISSLSKEPFIMWDRRQTGGIVSTVLALCGKHGFDPNVVLEVIDLQAMLSMVAGGLGVAIVPGSALHVKQEGLVYRPLRDRAYSELSLAWRRDNKRELLKRFIKVVAETTGEKSVQVN